MLPVGAPDHRWITLLAARPDGFIVAGAGFRRGQPDTLVTLLSPAGEPRWVDRLRRVHGDFELVPDGLRARFDATVVGWDAATGARTESEVPLGGPSWMPELDADPSIVRWLVDHIDVITPGVEGVQFLCWHDDRAWVGRWSQGASGVVVGTLEHLVRGESAPRWWRPYADAVCGDADELVVLERDAEPGAHSLVGVDPATGATRWRLPTEAGPYQTEMRECGRLICLSSYEKPNQWYDRHARTRVARFDGYPVWPTVDGDVVHYAHPALNGNPGTLGAWRIHAPM